jgi:hypothetical protein
MSTVAFAVGTGMLAFAPRIHEPQEQRPAVAGTWNLNAEKTQEPKSTAPRDVESTGSGINPGMGSRNRGGSASGRRSSVPGGGGGGGSSTAAARMVRDLMRAPATLLITQTDTAIVVDPGTGILVSVRTDGRLVDEPFPDGSTRKTKATWRTRDLIVERDFGESGAIRETYRLEPENPKVLIVEFHFENKRQRSSVDQRRVYDAGS